MKKLIYTIPALILFIGIANAQVGIETTTVSAKAILDFPDNADGGILLPYVETVDSQSVAGTIIYDTSDGAVYYKDKANIWVELSEAPKDASNKTSHEASLYTNTNADGAVISNTGTIATTKGVLVLESMDRALALPKVNGVENLQSPKAGTICYDTTRKSLAIFNGEKWILRN